MRLYGQILKVEPQDDGTIKVHGVASTEDVDDQGEIVRGAAIRAAIPGYMLFPAVREMHQLQAAGTALEIAVGDDNITRLVAHVVDPVAVTKVKTQVYRGFSIGGRVTQRDHKDSKVITGIDLNEISLVDRPANPEAKFEMWKAGASEGEHAMPDGLGTLADTESGKKLAALQPVQVWTCDDPAHRHTAKADAVKCLELKTASQDHEASESADIDLEEVAKRAEEGANAAQAALVEAQQAIERGEVTLVDEPAAKATEETGTEAETEADAETADEQPTGDADVAKLLQDANDAVAAAETVVKGGDAPGDGSKPYGDVEYADPGHLADGKKRYPIDTAAHVRSAWSYINKPANCAKYSSGDCAKVKARIVAAWKSKIDKDGPPSAGEKASRVDMAKSLYDVGELAMLVLALSRMEERLEYEASVEGDESSAPAKAHEACSILCEFLNELVAEETAEILEDEEIDEPLGMDMGPVAMSAITGSLRKHVDKDKVERLVSTLEKAGARHNATDQAHLDLAAHCAKTAMGMSSMGKGDMVHCTEIHKALIDAGATAHTSPTVGDGGGEDSLPSGGVTTHATVDTSKTAAAGDPDPSDAVPNKASDTSLMLDALAKASRLPEVGAGFMELLKAGAKPHHVLMDVAHKCMKAFSDGATCKADAAGPERHTDATMAQMHKAHFHFGKVEGSKCDAANPPPGGMPNADGESEEQGTHNSAKAATMTNHDNGDSIKAMIVLTQMLNKLADQLEIKNGEVAELTKAALAHEQRLEVVENQPASPKTAAAGTVAISKQQDGGGNGAEGSAITDDDVIKHFSKMSNADQTQLLIKGAWRQKPIQLPGFTDGPTPQNPRGPEPQS